MSRILRLALAGIVAPTLLIATAGAAHAQRWSAPDPEGDVAGWHHDPDPSPCGTTTDVDGSSDTNDDITRVAVRHGRTHLGVRVGFRDLDPSLEQSLQIVIVTPAHSWFLMVDRYQGRAGNIRVMAMLSRLPAESELDPGEVDECGDSSLLLTGRLCSARAEVDAEADVVRVDLPRSWLGDPRWARLGVQASTFVSDDPTYASYGGFSDFWGTRNEGSTSWLPPLGPKVIAPPRPQNGSPSNLSRVTNSSTSLRRSFVSTFTGLPRGITAATAN